MLLGKRPRPPIMRRTRSMSGGMAIDTQPPTDTNNLEPHHEEELMLSDSVHPHHHEHPFKDPHAVLFQANQTKNMVTTTVMFPSPTTTSITVNNHSQTQKKNPTINLNLPHDVIQHTPHFLRTCRLCTSPLAPGRDIYMYRGDTAFCSLECREKQIKQDQRKEKWKMASNKDEHRVISPPPTANTKSSTKTQTAACN